MTDKTVLTGNLDFLNLSELIQLLGSNGSSGVLRLLSKYVENPGFVYFHEGNPVDASNGAKQGLDALYSLFGWAEGDFEFEEGPVKDRARMTIKKSRMEIILEGLRLLDDGAIETKGALSFEVGPGEQEAKNGLVVIKGPLIDYMDVVAEEEFSDGQTIVHQGRHGTWMWVILEGKVDICKETSGGDLVPILKVGPGSFIGSMASFAYQGDVRSATAIASDRVQLGVLDRQRLTQEFFRLSSDFRNVILSLDKRLKQVTRLAASGKLGQQKIKNITKGKTPIVRYGDTQDRLLSIRQGSAYVVRDMPKGEMVLCKLEKNDFVGHIPFINIGHEPDSAAVFGTDDVKMKALNLEAMEEEYNSLSGTLKNMIYNSAGFISATTNIVNNLGKDKKTTKTGGKR